MPYSTKSFLTPHESRLAEKLAGWLTEKKRGKWTVFWKIHPTVFIDPKLEEFKILPELLRKACWEGVIAFAVVERKTNGRLLAAVIDERSKLAHQVKDLLDSFETPCLIADLQADQEFIRKFVKESVLPAAQLRRDSLRTKKVSSAGESWQRHHIEGYLERWRQVSEKFGYRIDAEEEIYCFQEASLNEFTTVPDDARFELRNYLNSSRVDFLLTTGAKCEPLLVFEYDGEHHQQESTKKRDRLKEEILIGAGVPLLRLRVWEMPFMVTSSKEDFDLKPHGRMKRESARLAEDLLRNVLIYVLRFSEYQAVELPALEGKSYEKKKRFFDEHLRPMLYRILKYPERLDELAMSSLVELALLRVWDAPSFYDFLEDEYKENGNVAEIPSYEVSQKIMAEADKFQAVADEILFLSHLEYENEQHFASWWRDQKRPERIFFSGSTLSIRKGTVDSYPCLFGTLTTLRDSFTICVPVVTLRYFGNQEINNEEFSLAIDSISWGAADLVLHTSVLETLDQLKVPNLIEPEQYHSWQKHWSRRWRREESDRLVALYEAGETVENIAAELDRSPRVIRDQLGRRSREYKEKIGKNEGTEESIRLAIRLERGGRKPGLPYLVHQIQQDK